MKLFLREPLTRRTLDWALVSSDAMIMGRVEWSMPPVPHAGVALLVGPRSETFGLTSPGRSTADFKK